MSVYAVRRPRPLLLEVNHTATPGAALGLADGALTTEEIADVIRQEVADTLGFSGPAEVPDGRTFPQMGMDSLFQAIWWRARASGSGSRDCGSCWWERMMLARSGQL